MSETTVLSAPDGKSTDTIAHPERRNKVARRFKAFSPTTLRTLDDETRVHILNISRTGAKLHGQSPVQPDQTIEVMIDDRWFGGTVRWRRGEIFGVAFHVGLPVDTLAALLIAK